MDRGASVSFLAAVAKQWREDRISRLAAALAYYAFTSAAAVLVIAVAVTAVTTEPGTLETRLLEPLALALGERLARSVRSMTDVFVDRSSSVATTVVSVAALLFSAARAFVALQDALNTLWAVDRKPAGITAVIKRRFVAFVIVSLAGLLLLILWAGGILLRTYAAALPNVAGSRRLMVESVDLAGSLGIQALVFAMLFKVLPAVRIGWRDVWLGAGLSSLLFTASGRTLGYYVQSSLLASAYGAAGSFVALLFWFYLAAQIVLLGAKFTQVYALQHGTHAALARRLREELAVR